MAGHVPFAKVDAWLRAPRSMWIATVRADGRPHLVPLWFYWDGHAIYFDTGASTLKHRNLSSNASAVAHVGDGDNPVIIEGLVRLVTDATELSRVDEAYRLKYVDPHTGATAGYPETAQDVPYRLDVERIMVWEYGSVSTRTDFVFEDRSWRGSVPVRI